MTESSCSSHKTNEDIISQLPSDILISIISRLPLRVTTATSILSSCWRYLHNYNTRLNFNFNFPVTLSNYKKLVDHALNSHRGSQIEEFEVHVDCWKGANFDKWFEFALTKKAEIIRITMSQQGRGLSLPLSDTTISLHGLSGLRELSLFRIDITDHDLEHLVSNCIALASLSIGYPLKLENVSIVGHSKLKQLDLSYVRRVGSIELRDMINLVSLKCRELPSKCVVRLSNIPRLIEIDFRENFITCVHDEQPEIFGKMPPCIRHQLQSLHLSTSYDAFYWMDRDLSVKFVNIKSLEVVLDMMYQPKSGFLLMYCFIGGFPSLQKLVIKFLWEPYYTRLVESVETETFEPWMMEKLSPKCLKELEIRGYLGFLPEFELASHMINYGGALEKLTVVASDLSDTARPMF